MNTIPKTIHYCWFGGNPLGEKELACIESWRRFLPDYKIVRWDESNFDVRSCSYVSEAFDAKKWAFVSDYARFKILFDHGGLYFDTDVELISPIDDIIAAGPFMGFETDCPGFGNNVDALKGAATVAAGLGLAANPGLGLYKRIIDSYSKDHFVKPDGSLDKTTVVYRVTAILREFGLENVEGIQQVAGVHIYPSEFFNPKSYETGEINITENTRSIHHFSMSWLGEKDLFEHKVCKRLRNLGLPRGVVFKLCAAAEIIRFADVGRVLKRIRRKSNFESI